MSAPVSLVSTIEYVAIDGDPCDHWRDTYDDSGLRFPVLATQWNALPDRYRTVLEELAESDPGDPVKCWRCDTPVGYVEEGREDTYGREYDATVWRFAALLADPAGGPVSVQCEECSPDVPPAPSQDGTR